MRPCQFALLDKGRGRIVALTDEQADALLKAAVADKDPYCWLFIAFGLNTTMRHGEILAHDSTNWISVQNCTSDTLKNALLSDLPRLRSSPGLPSRCRRRALGLDCPNRGQRCSAARCAPSIHHCIR
jgi:hypothetical protein